MKIYEYKIQRYLVKEIMNLYKIHYKNGWVETMWAATHAHLVSSLRYDGRTNFKVRRVFNYEKEEITT